MNVLKFGALAALVSAQAAPTCKGLDEDTCIEDQSCSWCIDKDSSCYTVAEAWDQHKKFPLEARCENLAHFQIVQTGFKVPVGKRVATVADAREWEWQWIDMLESYSIVALADGFVDGLGYPPTPPYGHIQKKDMRR